MTVAPPLTIDAHHHVWDVEHREHAWLEALPAIRRTFAADDLRPFARAAGVDATVLVQVLATAQDTQDLLAVAAADPLVLGVVGWVDLTAADVLEQVARLRALPGGDRLVGVRHLAADEPDPRWLLRDDVVRGLRALATTGLPYDVLLAHDRLPVAVELAALVPELPLVLDHLGKPAISDGVLDPWREHVTALAAHEQVGVKLSGMVTEAGDGWTVDTLRPYAEHVLASFGADRVMAGSDWPVCLLAASYGEVVDANRALVAGLSDDERAAVLGGTAAHVYGLSPRAPGRAS